MISEGPNLAKLQEGLQKAPLPYIPNHDVVCVRLTFWP